MNEKEIEKHLNSELKYKEIFMKTEKNILIAFILNFAFSIFECIGGIFTGSVAIVSDAIHDFGDAAGIGISYFLEKKSKRKPNDVFTYGYARYSTVGSLFVTSILIFNSIIVIYNSVMRIINPTKIDYDGMILISVIGICINFIATYFTHGGESLNQKAVNLHMIEDVLGWIIVLIGAIAMRFTNIPVIDPVMSVCVATFILFNTSKTLKEALNIFLEKAPTNLSSERIKKEILSITGVFDVFHIHVWSLDGEINCATMHIITDYNPSKIKEHIREKLHYLGIEHVTLELETNSEETYETKCSITSDKQHSHHRHCHH